MTQITTRSTSKRTADIIEDFIISENPTTRRIFKATIVDNPKDNNATLSGYIIYQKKSKNNLWEDIKELKLNQLKSGEGVKFYFSCSEMKNFFNALEKAYAVANNGVQWGMKKLVVEEAHKIMEVPAERKEFIVGLLNKNYGNDIWKELVSLDPDLATRLSYAKIQSDRRKVLLEFEKSLTEEKGEAYWQKFFENNKWVFGYGLKYQFLHLLQEQPHYGNTSVSGKGTQKGDYLLHTAAENKFTVIVEIKMPETGLFAKQKDGTIAKYRNGVPIPNRELTGAISQVQVNSKTWEIEGSNSPQNREALQSEKTFTHNPKGILIIGHTRQLDSYVKRKAFELFRSNITNPEIITFDELYERARFIVEGEGQKI